jgi:hypothetical protein
VVGEGFSDAGKPYSIHLGTVAHNLRGGLGAGRDLAWAGHAVIFGSGQRKLLGKVPSEGDPGKVPSEGDPGGEPPSSSTRFACPRAT